LRLFERYWGKPPKPPALNLAFQWIQPITIKSTGRKLVRGLLDTVFATSLRC